MKCASCPNDFHPATGHQFTDTCGICWECTLHFIQWMKGREATFSKPWRRPASQCSFITAALTSIKPGDR
jgi:hypothetical protein